MIATLSSSSRPLNRETRAWSSNSKDPRVMSTLIECIFICVSACLVLNPRTTWCKGWPRNPTSLTASAMLFCQIFFISVKIRARGSLVWSTHATSMHQVKRLFKDNFLTSLFGGSKRMSGACVKKKQLHWNKRSLLKPDAAEAWELSFDFLQS